MVNPVGPQATKIGGEANGICEEGEEVVNVVVVVGMEILEANVVDLVVEKEEQEAALDHLILSLATSAGCVAIWPVTVLKPVVHNHRGVAMLALPVGDSLNPGKKAHSVDEAVEGKSGSVP